MGHLAQMCVPTIICHFYLLQFFVAEHQVRYCNFRYMYLAICPVFFLRFLPHEEGGLFLSARRVSTSSRAATLRLTLNATEEKRESTVCFQRVA